MSLNAALLKLSDADDSHWTDDGAPRLDVLKRFGAGTVTRQQVAGTGRIRRTITAEADKPSTSATAAETAAEVEKNLYAVAAARDRLRDAEAAVKVSRGAVADALRKWLLANPRPDAMQVARDHAARDRARLQDEALGLVEPPEPLRLFACDAARAIKRR
ncbi:hypothetical protein [Bradyrhizobium genosp. P]|uniref:hypothetical protein n=1 Tax=Bradyrhizobium genosp. P TaxID=83641 RepID=UPI003CE71508